MNPSSNRINILQLFMVFSLMNGLNAHVIINPMLLDASGRDAWITVIVTGMLFAVWFLLIRWMNKKSRQQPWQEWISSSSHPILMRLIMIPVWIMLYLTGATTVVHTIQWNHTNYLPAVSDVWLVLSLISICLILTILGIQIIGITAGILFPVVCLLGIFVALSNTDEKNYQLLRPFLEYGWKPVTHGMIYAAGGFVEVMFLLLLQHQLSQKIKTWQMMLYCLFTIMITLGPIIGSITEFGPLEASKQMTSPYEQWRLVRVGRYIEHVDFFSIFQWLSGACIRVSLSVYLLLEGLQLKKKKHRILGVIIVMFSYIVISLIPYNEYSFYQLMYKTYIPISFFVLFSVSIIWLIITLFAKPVRKEKSNDPQ